METLFADLADHGDAVAVIDELGAAVSHASLAATADAAAAAIGPGRKLVAVEMANRLDAICAYVGAIRAGHAAILLPPGGAVEGGAILQRFDPDAIYRDADRRWTRRPSGRAEPPHPDLAVLLSTSGSTGSPKLVRLSHANLLANARAIIQYLQLGADEVAVTTLPPAYSYGLSVIHAHILAGARLVLFEGSVTAPGFAALLDRHGATSFAGVPHTFELLGRIGFRQGDHPSLRYLTQAGGRLPPDQVRAWAAGARACGQRFFVMYGQTEAAPRMAYMPPEDLEAHPDCIGVAVPGGALRIEPVEGRDDGELVYSGPNVMMGYAERREDLSRGADLTELRTGDLAHLTASGHLRITGRISRIAKVFGLRVSLDEVEARLAESGLTASAAADDLGLVIACPAAAAELATGVLRQGLKLPRAAFQILAIDHIPRLASGKPDYPAILRLAREPDAKDDERPGLRQALAQLLGVRQVRDNDSFISLGGDSLNYVRAWLLLEQRLGRCPDGWESMTMAELEGVTRDGHPGRMAIDADVLVRAAAITMVVAHHVTNDGVGGGAASLLLVAGMNFARFQAPKLAGGQFWPVLQPLLTKVIAPYFAILTAYFIIQHAVFLPQYLLFSTFTPSSGAPDPARTTVFWYVETYVWLVLASALAMASPPARRAWARAPWAVSLGLLLVTLVVGAVARLSLTLPAFFEHTPFSLAYLFGFGWAISQARTPRRRVLIAALAVVALFGLERPGVEFAAPMSLAAVLLLLFARKITLGWKLTQAASATAAASLYIYLSHGMVIHGLRAVFHGRIPLALALPAIALCSLVGIGLARLVDAGEALGARWLARLNLVRAEVTAEA